MIMMRRPGVLCSISLWKNIIITVNTQTYERVHVFQLPMQDSEDIDLYQSNVVN